MVNPIGTRVSEMLVDYITKVPSASQRGTSQIRAEMHHFWLDRYFRGAVRDVMVEYAVETDSFRVGVRFHNGHCINVPEADIKKDETLAMMTLIYDLPPKE